MTSGGTKQQKFKRDFAVGKAQLFPFFSDLRRLLQTLTTNLMAVPS